MSFSTRVGPVAPATHKEKLAEEPLKVKEAAVFINSNPAYITGNIQYTYIYQYIVHSKMVLKSLNSLVGGLCKRYLAHF